MAGYASALGVAGINLEDSTQYGAAGADGVLVPGADRPDVIREPGPAGQAGPVSADRRLTSLPTAPNGVFMTSGARRDR